jgi:hypothetical protein
LKYFNNNWTCCEDKWVKYRRIGLKIISNNTNNAVESLNNHFKRFIDKNQRINVCLECIFGYLTFRFNKYDYNSVLNATKKCKYIDNTTDKCISICFEITTKRNAEWLAQQYELSKLTYVVKYHYFNESESIDALQMANIKTKNNFHEIKSSNSKNPQCSC